MIPAYRIQTKGPMRALRAVPALVVALLAAFVMERAGAQDYLVKGRVDPETLRRALLYAIERKRAQLIAAGEEFPGKDRGEERVDGEVVPLQHVADDGGAERAPPHRGRNVR